MTSHNNTFIHGSTGSFLGLAEDEDTEDPVTQDRRQSSEDALGRSGRTGQDAARTAVEEEEEEDDRFVDFLVQAGATELLDEK